ncbi:Sucrase/ferredoxin-like-domain-containing protein [Mycena filopes]|nr:Sucrase/ferredoxin-like-domain-containing protein [Mycena filopes]
MSGLRKLKAWVLHHELNPDNIFARLAASAVPVSSEACRTCSDPCEDGHGEYPSRFTVDMETQMLGSVRPFRRQVLISTGATDWAREITSTSGSLAAHVSSAHHKIAVAPSAAHSDSVPPIHGIFRASESGGLSILNGSHKSISDNHELQTVLIFPDFVMIADIPSSPYGAQLLCKNALDSRAPRILDSSGTPFNTWVVPYSCVITFCSHKRRDNRCGISAPKLESAFADSLNRRGWTVDTQLEHNIDPPLEEFSGTAEEKDAHVTRTLEELQSAKKALILYNSHMGGHRYAGNCIIHFPNGSSVWYGRLTPHEVESVVVETVEKGLILPPLLRGGVNLSKPGCKTLHDW